MLIAERYRLVRPLGQGGMGRVWAARDELLGRDVAIKEIVSPVGLPEDELRTQRKRSIREARAIAQLDHANVVRVFDVVFEAGDPWIVMELVQSRSLYEAIQTDGPMAPQRVARIGLGVLAALRAAHQVGLLHRDVKPGNVLLAHDDRVVLTDFGLASVAGDATMTSTGVVLGSPSYLAPERALDQEVGAPADLWSLGATLYAAVEGRPPYSKSSALATLAALATELPPPPERAGVLSPALTGLLQRDPAQRIDGETAQRLLLDAAAGRRPAQFGRQFGAPTFAGPAEQAPAVAVPQSAVTAPGTDLSPASEPAAGSTPAAGGGSVAEGGSAAGSGSVAGSTPAAGGGSVAEGGSAAGSGSVAGTTPAAEGGAAAGSAPTAGSASTAGNGPKAEGLAATSAAADAGPAVSGPKPDPADRPAPGPSRRHHILLAVVVVLLVAGTGGGLLLAGADGSPSALEPGAVVTSSGPPIAASVTPSLVAPSRIVAPSGKPTGKKSAKPAQPSRLPGSTVTVTSPVPVPATSTPAASAPGHPVKNVASGTCLYAPKNSDQVQLRRCADTDQFRFDFQSDRTMRVLGRCVQVDSADDGSQLRLADCTGRSRQRFTYTDELNLVNEWSGKCLDASDGSSVSGIPAQIWECTVTDNEKWTF